MSISYAEAQNLAVDEEAARLKEYTLSQSSEVENFIVQAHIIEPLSVLIAEHWNKPSFGPAIQEFLNEQLDEETADQARERIYG